MIPSMLRGLCAWRPNDNHDIYTLQTCAALVYGGGIGSAIHFSNVVTGWWSSSLLLCVIGFALLSVVTLCTPRIRRLL